MLSNKPLTGGMEDVMGNKRVLAWIGIGGFVILLVLLFIGMIVGGALMEVVGYFYMLVAVVFLVWTLRKKTSRLQDEADEAKKKYEDQLREKAELEAEESGELKVFQTGFGREKIKFSVDNKNLLMEVRQNELKEGRTGEDSVRHAMQNPIGTSCLKDIVKPNEKIVLVTSDVTRPMPSNVVVPVVLEELYAAGVKKEDITIVFGIGSHRKQTENEMKYLVGEDVYRQVRCVDSDPDDCINMGTTKMGTPIDIARVVAEADKRICLANIEYHYFAGYSGGGKSIMPGVSSRAAIQANHSSMIKENACAGVIQNNPVRDDIEEAIQSCPIDFIINVILNEKKQIVKTVAGHYIEAHRAGCSFLDSMYKITIPAKADIVITTPGGYPKDINLYQAQKALDNAKNAVKDGGIIILSAACTEGMGEGVFERWYSEAKSPQDLIDRVQKNFELGGHKAAAIALVMKKAKIFLVSDFSEDETKKMFMYKYNTIEEALLAAYAELGETAGVLVMPYGSSTLPM